MPPKPKHKNVSNKKGWYTYISDENKASQWSMMRITGLTVLVGIVSVFLYYGYMETRINTPLSVPKVVVHSGVDVPHRYWGTYRPGVYFGTSVRHPLSPITGMMWYTNGHFQNGMLAIRHWCEQGDNLKQFGWVAHNGRNFGAQTIKDQKVDLETYFVKRASGSYEGDWSARIKVMPKSPNSKEEEVTIIYYLALNPDDVDGEVRLSTRPEKGMVGSLEGYSESLGNFKLHVVPYSGYSRLMGYLASRHLGFDHIKETALKGLRFFQNKETGNKFISFMGEDFSEDDLIRKADFIAFQINGQPPFEVDIVFESKNFTSRPSSLIGDELTSEIKLLSTEFDEEFETKFGLRSRGYSEEEVNFAKAALSNMIGGIGYFYGSSKVQGINNQEPVPYWKAPLYSAVPSRSFFPRGFLWDEGFHNLLISKWDKEISMDIIAHWLDLMNWDGWIPREQILGVEARARVPDEFVVQHNKAANPPTIILTLHSMMSGFGQSLSQSDLEYLNHLWPRLKAWYNWYNTTQLGSHPGTYRWRGRVSENAKELNPKTLTSGLDDYPRASHPTNEERHLDLRCWMTLASGLMAKLAKIIEIDSKKFEESYKFLSDNLNLDSLHWSYSSNGYMDYGLHTDGVILKRLNPKMDKVRVVNENPKLRFVDSFGYVSFFPLFLQIVDPNSARLHKMLEDLRRPELLWTHYGLRSLAKNSPFYNKWNTEHDPPYWRGSIWININFLAVRSLKYYSMQNGPNRDLAAEVYRDLRKNIIDNVYKQYKETGYLWEHYNDKTGKGEGCKPFTGWTALVVLMMGETY